MTDIFVLTCNRPHLLSQTLQAIRERIRVSHRVVVINNGSQDETADLIASYTLLGPHTTICIPPDERVSMVEAGNVALRNAKTEYFIMCHDDFLVPDLDPDVLVQLLDIMARHPDYAALSLRHQQMKRRFPLGVEVSDQVRAVSACFRIHRTEDFKKIGYLGRGRRWEDSAVLAAAQTIGKKVGITPHLWAKHIGTESFRGYPAWYRKERRGDKSFEWIDNVAPTNPDPPLDPLTNAPLDLTDYISIK